MGRRAYLRKMTWVFSICKKERFVILGKRRDGNVSLSFCNFDFIRGDENLSLVFRRCFDGKYFNGLDFEFSDISEGDFLLSAISHGNFGRDFLNNDNIVRDKEFMKIILKMGLLYFQIINLVSSFDVNKMKKEERVITKRDSCGIPGILSFRDFHLIDGGKSFSVTTLTHPSLFVIPLSVLVDFYENKPVFLPKCSELRLAN